MANDLFRQVKPYARCPSYCLLHQVVLNFGCRVVDGQPIATAFVKKVGMRSIFKPITVWLLLAVCCAALVLQGCAKPERAKPAGSKSLLVDKQSKPQSESKPDPQQPAEPVKETPKLEITQSGVTLRWAEKNGSQMTASAKSADFNEVTQVGSLLDFSAQLYENGKLTAGVSAPKATVDTDKRTVIASGGVTLKSLERSTVIKAGWIKWDANTRKVMGNGGVKITSDTGVAEAAAFIADTSLKSYTLLSSGKELEKY